MGSATLLLATWLGQSGLGVRRGSSKACACACVHSKCRRAFMQSDPVRSDKTDGWIHCMYRRTCNPTNVFIVSAGERLCNPIRSGLIRRTDGLMHVLSWILCWRTHLLVHRSRAAREDTPSSRAPNQSKVLAHLRKSSRSLLRLLFLLVFCQLRRNGSKCLQTI